MVNWEIKEGNQSIWLEFSGSPRLSIKIANTLEEYVAWVKRLQSFIPEIKSEIEELRGLTVEEDPNN